jgi:hypothetical protein
LGIGDKTSKAMNKTDGEILSEIKPSTITDNGKVLMEFYLPIQVMSAMTAAREDERERIRLLITNEVFFLSDKPDSKDRWAISRMNKLLDQLK